MSKRRTDGFTLVELMVALIAGAFVVSSVYYLNGVTSRTFGEQMRVSETQLALRSAMEQLRREFARAGYLHTPNSALNPDCTGAFNVVGAGTEAVGPRALRAINLSSATNSAEITALNGVGVANLLANNSTRADRVDTWGNYATADAYLTDPASMTSPTTQIVLQSDSESFRRSFGELTDTTYATRFNAAFAAGRMLRIEHEGRLFFRDIAAVDPASRQITLTAALPSCFEPTRWTAVSPVVHYRYALEPDTNADFARLRSNAPVAANRTLLVRREWNDVTDTAVADSVRVLLDYAVEFGVDAISDSNVITAGVVPVQRPVWQLVRRAAAAAVANGTPHNLRSLIVTLSTRSTETDPRLTPMARTTFNQPALLDSPLLTFTAATIGTTTLVSRVRTVRSEIFLQNL